MSRLSKRIIMATAAVVVAVVVLLAPVHLGNTRIVTEVDIARASPEIFAYVTTPGNWPKWHPSSLAVHGAVDHPLEVGESVVEEFRVAGRQGRVNWHVTKREPDRLWQISGDIDGREAGVVIYTLETKGNRTHFRREFEYRSPNLLFTLLNWISLQERINAESTQALQQLKERLELPKQEE
jgi:hypothetical protein